MGQNKDGGPYYAKIMQGKHSSIEIDNREKDCILIWMKENGSKQSEVVIIHRNKLHQFINVLQNIEKQQI